MGTSFTIFVGHLGLIARPIVFYFCSDFFHRVKPLAIATECLQGKVTYDQIDWDKIVTILNTKNWLTRCGICPFVVRSGQLCGYSITC